MKRKHLIASGAAAALMLSAGLTALPALAQTPNASQKHNGEKPAAFGVVAGVSGTTILLDSKLPKTATTTYTVDASNATIIKGIGKNATTTIAVSDIAVGDRLVVRGTVSGTTITATKIRDGLAAKRIGKRALINKLKAHLKHVRGKMHKTQ
jgi:hypothetical protein